eukprot:scaffold20241_cov69-Phaeocystis_antarctica.AAC.1
MRTACPWHAHCVTAACRRALLPLASLLPEDQLRPATDDAVAAAAELLPAIWEGLGSEHLAAAHVGALLEAYGELLLLLLVAAARGAEPSSAARRQAALLRAGAAAPLRALLTASLPPRLSDGAATASLVAMLARLGASSRCTAALHAFWPELRAMCEEAAPATDAAARRRVSSLLLALRQALLDTTAPPAAACLGSLLPQAARLWHGWMRAWLGGKGGGGEGGDEGGGGAVLELARGFGVGALWAGLQARRPPSAEAEAAPAAAAPVLLLLPASASSVSVALLSLAPRAAAEATAHLACFERLLLPHATSLLAGAAGGGGGDGAAEGSGLWRLCGMLLAEQVAAAELAAEAEAALLLQAVGAQWRRLLGTALDDAAPPRWLPLLGLLRCVRGCGTAAQWRCAALDALCAKACSDALGGGDALGGAAARAAARRVAVLCLETGALGAASLAHLARL